MLAAKAAGANRRLNSVGKTFELSGKGLDGRTVDVAKFRGKITLVHYWATWCEPCKQDMVRLNELSSKYGRRGRLAIVGVNLDADALARQAQMERLHYEIAGRE